MKRFWKSICAAVLTVTVAAALSLGASAVGVSDFEDVRLGAWYYKAVEYAVKNGLFAGTSKTTFSPNTPMTRGMFVTVLGRKNGVGKNAYPDSRFKDVAADAYYAPYVEWAAENGIVNGTGNGNFSPERSITREQMAAILYHYAGYIGADTEIYMSFDYFEDDNLDFSKVSGYARDGIDWALGAGIIKGSLDSSGKLWLSPQGTATRAQVAQVFLNAKDWLQEPEELPVGISTLSNGKPVTEDNVRELLYSLQNQFPEGTPWGNGYPDGIIEKYGDAGCNSFAYMCWCICGADSHKSTWVYTESSAADFDDLRVGDMVGYRNENAPMGHVVIVMEKHSDEIILAEGNYNGTVHWGRVITRQELETAPHFSSASFYPVS